MRILQPVDVGVCQMQQIGEVNESPVDLLPSAWSSSNRISGHPVSGEGVRQGARNFQQQLFSDVSMQVLQRDTPSQPTSYPLPRPLPPRDTPRAPH